MDAACGSANKCIPKLLKISGRLRDRFSEDNIVDLKMCYPYRFNEIGIFRGVQQVKYNQVLGTSDVVGYANYLCRFNITFNKTEGIIFK